MQRGAGARVIAALDTPSLNQAVRIAKQLQGLIQCVKIGSILFTAEGPRAIERMRALGFDVFLDLKFHDIPSTVEKSCRAAVAHRIAMLTVHASGGREMLHAAAAGVRHEAARLRIRRPKVVGVTVLTSQGAADQAGSLRRDVIALAQTARHAGLDGVVASPQEARDIRRRMPRPWLIVCPGIRPAGASKRDQARVATPRQALDAGADWLVVGRPITEAARPREATCRIIEELERGSRC